MMVQVAPCIPGMCCGVHHTNMHTQKKHKKYQRKEKVGDVLQVTRTMRSRELRSATPRSQPAEPRLREIEPAGSSTHALQQQPWMEMEVPTGSKRTASHMVMEINPPSPGLQERRPS